MNVFETERGPSQITTKHKLQERKTNEPQNNVKYHSSTTELLSIKELVPVESVDVSADLQSVT